MTRIEPNPYSPFSTADRDSRHIFRAPFGSPLPILGALHLTLCGRLAVVRDQLRHAREADKYDGMCLACMVVRDGFDPPTYPLVTCGECGDETDQNGLCVPCSIKAHDEWRAALAPMGRP